MQRFKYLIRSNILAVLHFVGWSVYILGDYADHVLGYGVTYAIPSIGSGLAAYILTGSVALLNNAISHWYLRYKVPVFLLALYAASLVWNKIWTAMHTDSHALIIAALKAIPEQSLVQWIETGYVPLLLFLSWAGLYLGAKTFLSEQDKLAELNVALLETKKAQLQTLRYQLNPHFLFNSLNSVDVCVQCGDKEIAHKMIKHLTSFLRRSLEQGEQDKIPLEKELGLIRDFVAIEELRYGDKIRLYINLEPSAEHAMVPPMFLQPLVENAIKFAWNQTSSGQVELSIQTNSNKLSVRVTNNIVEGAGDIVGTGTGLKNTRERLSLLYGSDCNIETISGSNKFIVKIELPFEASI